MASLCSPSQHHCHMMHLFVLSQPTSRGKWRLQSSVCANSAIIIKQTSLRRGANVQLWKSSCNYATSTQQQQQRQPPHVLAVLEDYPSQVVAKDVTGAGPESPLKCQDWKPVVVTRTVKRRGRAKEHSDNGFSATTTGQEGLDLKVLEGPGFTKAEIREGMKSDKCTLHLAELGVEMPALARCFDQSRGVPESQWRNLLTVLEEFGISRVDLVSIITKDPSILGGDPDLMKQLLNFGIEQGLDSAVVISMCKLWPGLLLQCVDHVKELVRYFSSVGLYREDLIKIIKQRPQLLGHNVDRIRCVVDSLLDYGVPVEDLPRIIRKAPELFSNLTYTNMVSNLEFLVSMGLGAGGLGKAVARRPNLLNYSLESMRTTVQYLEMFMQPRDIPKLIKRYAEVLVLDPVRKMHPMITYLTELGVKPKDIGKVILRRPQLLGYTIPGLEPSVNCLLEFGVKQEMIGKVITTAPQILTLNVKDKLRPVVDFFRTMGLNKERDIELLLVRNGQILCCSIEENLRPKFEFLLGLGLSTKDIANMIVLFPSMLGQSIEGSLGPKYDYLVNVMKRPIYEVIDFPQYFGYSLEKRIMPRHEKLYKKAISTSLPSMLACVDRDFELRYMLGKPPTRAPYKARRKVISV